MSMTERSGRPHLFPWLRWHPCPPSATSPSISNPELSSGLATLSERCVGVCVFICQWVSSMRNEAIDLNDMRYIHTLTLVHRMCILCSYEMCPETFFNVDRAHLTLIWGALFEVALATLKGYFPLKFVSKPSAFNQTEALRSSESVTGPSAVRNAAFDWLILKEEVRVRTHAKGFRHALNSLMWNTIT